MGKRIKLGTDTWIIWTVCCKEKGKEMMDQIKLEQEKNN